MCSLQEIADSFLFKSDDDESPKSFFSNYYTDDYESPKSCFSNYYINHFEWYLYYFFTN